MIEEEVPSNEYLVLSKQPIEVVSLKKTAFKKMACGAV
jgi:hypothetical protein